MDKLLKTTPRTICDYSTKEYSNNSLIRILNIAWRTTPITLINYMKKKLSLWLLYWKLWLRRKIQSLLLSGCIGNSRLSHYERISSVHLLSHTRKGCLQSLPLFFQSTIKSYHHFLCAQLKTTLDTTLFNHESLCLTFHVAILLETTTPVFFRRTTKPVLRLYTKVSFPPNVYVIASNPHRNN